MYTQRNIRLRKHTEYISLSSEGPGTHWPARVDDGTDVAEEGYRWKSVYFSVVRYKGKRHVVKDCPFTQYIRDTDGFTNLEELL